MPLSALHGPLTWSIIKAESRRRTHSKRDKDYTHRRIISSSVDSATSYKKINAQRLGKPRFRWVKSRLKWKWWDDNAFKRSLFTDKKWWLGSLVAKALDLQLAGCEFNSRPRRCRVTNLGKLFIPTCLSRSQWFSDDMIDCGVTGRGQLCLRPKLHLWFYLATLLRDKIAVCTWTCCNCSKLHKQTWLVHNFLL